MNGLRLWAAVLMGSAAVWACPSHAARADDAEAPPGYRIEYIYVDVPVACKKIEYVTIFDEMGRPKTVCRLVDYTVVRRKPVPIYVPIDQGKKEEPK